MVLHVCFVTESYLASSGPAENLAAAGLHSRARALLEAGHAVTVVTGRQHPAERGERLDGVRVVRIPVRAGKLALPQFVVGASAALAWVHKRQPVSLVHGHWATTAGFAGVQAARLIARPSVVSVKGFDVQYAEDQPEYGAYRSPRMRRIVRYTLSRATGVKCISGQLQRRILEDWGVARPDIRVIYPAVPEALLSRPAARAEGPLRVLTVGGLRSIKRVEDAVAAAALLHQRGVPFEYRIVGPDRGTEGVLGALIREAGLSEQVALTGPMQGAALKAAYDWADVLVAPSVLEGFGMSVLEAMARARTVIVTARAGSAEIVRNGVSGFVVEPYDTAAMARRLAQLAGDRALVRSAGDAARAVVERGHRYQHWIAQVEALYGQVLDTGRTQKVAHAAL